MILKILISCFFAYIIGSLNFSILISKKFYKKNIKKMGSKNAGMTNVLRNFGVLPALVVFILDILKGIMSIFICYLICKKSLNNNLLVCVEYMAALSVQLGHIFPIFHKFKGGKGVLVIAGSIIFINIKVFLVLITVFVLVFKFSKTVSLSSISATFFLPVSTFFINYFNKNLSGLYLFLYTFFSTIISIIIIFAHKNNIKRLLEKKEPKIKK